jgi:hypothetical protein
MRRRGYEGVEEMNEMKDRGIRRGIGMEDLGYKG